MFCGLLLALFVLALEPEFFVEAAGARYGRIIIEGNTDTPDYRILDLVQMRPGMKLSAREMRAARERLRESGYFAINPWQGTAPRVELLPNELDNSFMDVRIRVDERPGNWLVFGIWELIESTAVAVAYLNCDRFVYDLDWLLRRWSEEGARLVP
jgi:hypothetical protein